MHPITRTLSAFFQGHIKGHTGQWAEDVVVRKLFLRSKKEGVYVDLGAHHPFLHSNTAWLWLKGWNGINVDANHRSIKLFKKIRKQDINLNLAIIPSSQYKAGTRSIDLYLPEENSIETGKNGITATASISHTVASKRKHQRTEQVPAIDITTLFTKYNLTEIDYLNIDVEGVDEQILKDIYFSTHSIHVISIEDYSSSIQCCHSLCNFYPPYQSRV